MADRIVSLADAVTLVADGALLGIGGALLKRKPLAFLSALAADGRRELRAVSFLASLDAELLAVRGCLAELHCGYVGFEQLGFAPAVTAATEAGRLTRIDYDEIVFASGLRAALAGLPFLPTRGGTGSQVTADLGLHTVTCPYTGQELLAAPAIRPDVTVLHAEAADRSGNVLGPAQADFLFDMDANIARASGRVIVTVERLLDRAEIVATNRRTLLFGFEVDAVVVAPRGAHPTALPGSYSTDVGALRRYLADVAQDPERTERAMSALVPDPPLTELAQR